jgi:two-component system OmpR family response regulator
MPHILLVDDDEELRHLLTDYLSRYGYNVHCAKDGTDMYRQLTQHPIDLVVLDLTLPGGVDGMVLARELYSHSNLAIIMLTARSSAFDRVAGLESGADDYIVKPFEPRELVSRIQSVLRRHRKPQELPLPSVMEGVICFDGWELHSVNRCLYTPDGVVLALSNAEFRLMCTFLHAPRQPFSRDQLMRHTREGGHVATGRNIDLLVSRLRHKLARVTGGEKMIRTVRGVGYVFNVRTILGALPAAARTGARRPA